MSTSERQHRTVWGENTRGETEVVWTVYGQNPSRTKDGGKTMCIMGEG